MESTNGTTHQLEEQPDGKKSRKRRAAQRDDSGAPKKLKYCKEMSANTQDEKKGSGNDRVKRSAAEKTDSGRRKRKTAQREAEPLEEEQGGSRLCEEPKEITSRPSKRARVVQKVRRAAGAKARKFAYEDGTDGDELGDTAGINAISELPKSVTELQGGNSCEGSEGCSSSTQPTSAKVARKVRCRSKTKVAESDGVSQLSETSTQLRGANNLLGTPGGPTSSRRTKSGRAVRKPRHKFGMEFQGDSEVIVVEGHCVEDLNGADMTSQFSEKQTEMERDSKLCEVYENVTSSSRSESIRSHQRKRRIAGVKGQEVREGPAAEVEKLDSTSGDNLASQMSGNIKELRGNNKLHEAPEGLIKRSKRVEVVQELQRACDVKLQKVSEPAEAADRELDDVSEVAVTSQQSKNLMEGNERNDDRERISAKDGNMGACEVNSPDSHRRNVPENEMKESKSVKRTRRGKKSK